MGEEFKTVSADFDKFQHEVRMDVLEQEAKAKKDFEINKIKIEEN